MTSNKYDILIIGGGFFGMYIAEYFASLGKAVVICEKEHSFMQRASYGNQARVHSGYHYPRSILTAIRSRVLFPKFCKEFSNCIDDTFDKYYLIGELLSNVTSRQFKIFCQRIGAACEPAPHKITKLVNPKLVEAVFSTIEYAFDSEKLSHQLRERLESRKVDIKLNTIAKSIKSDGSKLLVDTHPTENPAQIDTLSVNQVFNCTYSMINQVLHSSGLDLLPFKQEITEICMVEVPNELKSVGLTMMCGPFFSVMPFPPRNLHSFSHVRYTPHYDWQENSNKVYVNSHDYLKKATKLTAWRKIVKDAQRYIPLLAECKYKDSVWEVKSVLPRSETDDSRPILFRHNYGIKGFHCILGGKIDNIYDAIETIEKLGLNR